MSDDDALEEYVSSLGVKVFRGDEEDVMGRVLGAARAFNADVICEVTKLLRGGSADATSMGAMGPSVVLLFMIEAICFHHAFCFALSVHTSY